MLRPNPAHKRKPQEVQNPLGNLDRIGRACAPRIQFQDLGSLGSRPWYLVVHFSLVRSPRSGFGFRALGVWGWVRLEVGSLGSEVRVWGLGFRF